MPPLRLTPLLAAPLLAALLLSAAASAQTAPAPAATPTGDAPEIRAQLSPRRITVLSSEIAGKILDLPLREGDRFAEGQRLVALDCSAHRAALAHAAAEQDVAQKTYEANSKLDKLSGISALEVQVAAANLARAQADVALARNTVERCTVQAPFAGRIGEVSVKRYQFVAEGQAMVEILDDRDLEAELIVPSRWLGWMKPGARFGLRIEETGKAYEAEIVRLSAKIDPVSQSIKVFGRVLGNNPELLPGMSGQALLAPPS
ncbi:MAG TPA: efflux RND transporter periplasmic adaptor subunit [Alphaproteobacteria bacterium]|nr:efflux RND transporter periplasmic adaptor subunit [Alphaproteobacteria bacterium]